MPQKKKPRIKHNKKVFVIIAIIAILLVLIIIFIPKQNNNNNIEKECSSDSDCILQETSCCNCNMGGEQVCMSKKNASIIQEKLKNCEKNIMCIALYNCRQAKCGCVDNKCREQ